MAKLIVTREGVVEQTIQLSKERMTFGRHRHNDVVLNHPAVSGEHGVITTILDDSFLEDLHSTNGTFVNGHRIGKHFLQNKDVIKMAKYHLEFVQDGIRPLVAAAAAAPTAPALPTVTPGIAGPSSFENFANAAAIAARTGPQTIPPRTSSAGPAGAASAYAAVNVGTGADVGAAASGGVAAGGSVSAAPAHAAGSSGPAGAASAMAGAAAASAASAVVGAASAATDGMPLGRVELLNGPNAGKSMTLTKAATSLGRPGVQVVIISRTADGYTAAHIEGAQTPLLNNMAMTRAAQRLSDGDVLDLGGTQMSFRME